MGNTVVKISTQADTSGVKQTEAEINRLRGVVDKLTKSAEAAAAAVHRLGEAGPQGTIRTPGRKIPPPAGSGSKGTSNGLATESNSEFLGTGARPSASPAWTARLSNAIKRGNQKFEDRQKKEQERAARQEQAQEARERKEQLKQEREGKKAQSSSLVGRATSRVSGALGSGMSMIPKLGMAAVGFAGISSIFSGMSQAKEYTIAMSDLSRKIAGARAESEGMGESFLTQLNSLNLTRGEVARAVTDYASLAGTMGEVKDVSESMKAGGGFARAFGLDVGQTMGQLGQLTQEGAINTPGTNSVLPGKSGNSAPEMRDFAGWIAEAVSSGNMFGRESELLGSVQQLVSLQTRSSLRPEGTKDMMAMLTAMNGMNVAGMKGAAGANLLGALDSGFKNPGGGAAGRALLYKYLGEKGDPFDFEAQLQEGAFGASQNFQKMMPGFLADTKGYSENMRAGQMVAMFPELNYAGAKGIMSAYRTMGSNEKFGEMGDDLNRILDGQGMAKPEKLGIYSRLYSAKKSGVATPADYENILKDPSLKLTDEKRKEIAGGGFDAMIKAVEALETVPDKGDKLRAVTVTLTEGIATLGDKINDLTLKIIDLVTPVTAIADGIKSFLGIENKPEETLPVTGRKNEYEEKLLSRHKPPEEGKALTEAEEARYNEDRLGWLGKAKNKWHSYEKKAAEFDKTDPDWRLGPIGKKLVGSSETEIRKIISDTATEHGLDPAGMQAMASLESEFDPSVTNKFGYKGLFQFGPSASRAVKLPYKDMTDPRVASEAGARYAEQNIEAMKKAGIPEDEAKSIKMIYAAHNMGPNGAVQIWKAAHGQGNVSRRVRKNMMGQAEEIRSGDPAEFLENIDSAMNRRVKQAEIEVPKPAPAKAENKAANSQASINSNHQVNVFLDGVSVSQAAYNQGRGSSTRNIAASVG